MSEHIPVSKERHSSRTWQRPKSYRFASMDPVAMLVSHEMPRAIMSMATAFMETGGSFMPVAIQGLKQGDNKYVSPDGRWLGDYVPAIYRAYPFKLGRSEDGSEVLCVDEASAQVSEHSTGGEPFFKPDGTPAPAISEAIKILGEWESNRKTTRIACDTLARHNLLEPWALKAQVGDELIQASGLFRIAETGLYTLDPAALTEIRNSGGLLIAFAQLFSMQQIHKLSKLGAPAPSPIAPVAGPKLTEDNGIISFANL